MKRFKHNLSNYQLTTCDMGKLIPIGCTEMLPGDSVQHNTNVVIRVSPLAAPIMHPVTARVHHFFVPNRLSWEFAQGEGTWEDFITGGPDGLNNASPPTKQNTVASGDLLDHLGLPRVLDVEVNVLPIAACNMIYNEYYRDQDLAPEATAYMGAVQNISWEKDYFTTARPFSQKGPTVTLPLGDKAPVTGIGTDAATPAVVHGSLMRESDGTERSYGTAWGAASPGYVYIEEDATNADYPGIYADLSNATGANITEIRRAFAIQRYQEARSRYGSRYTEYLRYLGVRNPKDQRLQRPELLGGGKVQLQFSEIMQSAPNTGTAPENGYGVGDLYGHGMAAMRSNAYRRYIEEHGYIITMLSVRPKAIYQNGIHRSWLRKTKEDYFQKELQHIGQQEIYNNELFADLATGDQTFGYNDRYSEYRSSPSLVSSEFRDTLNYWHMARDFQAMPTLNQSFVECDATKRIHNVQSEHALWVACQHKMVARRIVTNNPTPRVL